MNATYDCVASTLLTAAVSVALLAVTTVLTAEIDEVSELTLLVTSVLSAWRAVSRGWSTQQVTRALLEPRAVTCAVMGVMSELLRVLMDMEVKACDVDTALVTAAF